MFRRYRIIVILLVILQNNKMHGTCFKTYAEDLTL